MKSPGCINKCHTLHQVSHRVGSSIKTVFSNRYVSRVRTHHAEAGPKAVHVLRIVDEDQNHHPLDQILDRGLVTAEPSFKHMVQQSGDKLLRTHAQQKHTQTLVLSERLCPV